MSSKTNILIIEKNPKITSYLSMVIEREFGFDYDLAPSAEIARSLYQENSYSIVVCGYPMDETLTSIVDSFEQKGSVCPIIFFADKKNSEKLHKITKRSPVFFRISVEDNVDALLTCFKKVLKITSRRNKKNEGYCKMSIRFFKNFEESPKDLYIKISENKYVKVFNRGQDLALSDIAKYEDRKIDFLFLKASDYYDLTSRFITDFLKEYDVSEHDSSSVTMVSLLIQESVGQVVNKLGVDDSVLELTGQSIEMVLDLVSRNEDVLSLLKNLLNGKDYLSEHSTMLGVVACGIASALDYGDESIFIKLTAASFFHDIKLETDEMTHLRSVDQLNQSDFGHKNVIAYKNHPLEAAEIVRSISGLPYDVEKIIEQHHEMPDGSGFPKGLDYKRINILASIFIVAEEFVDSVYHSGFEKENLKDVIGDIITKYKKGNFTLASNALKKVFAWVYKKDGLISDTKKIAS